MDRESAIFILGYLEHVEPFVGGLGQLSLAGQSSSILSPTPAVVSTDSQLIILPGGTGLNCYIMLLFHNQAVTLR